MLLESARKRVHETSYSYKKGKSRSKQVNPSTECDVTTPKRKKISSDVRLHRIAEIQERLIDTKDQIGFKEKRRENAEISHNYKDCDKLTEQISTLKSEKRDLHFELSSLQKSSTSLSGTSHGKLILQNLQRQLPKPYLALLLSIHQYNSLLDPPQAGLHLNLSQLKSSAHFPRHLLQL